MERKKSYNLAEKYYDKGRPPYPREVIDWIVSKTNMTRDDNLLEIAPGTGQATLEFAGRGYQITCVELAENLANILIKKVKTMNVKVEVAAFEEWISPQYKNYNTIYCATAFHWLDPKVKFKKCSDLLAHAGHLVLFWNVFSNVKSGLLKDAYDLLWKYCPDKKHIDSEVLKEIRKAEINNSGEFYLSEYVDYKWSLSQNREELISGFYSQSSFLSLDESKQEELKIKLDNMFEGLDKVIHTNLSTTVYICKKANQTVEGSFII